MPLRFLEQTRITKFHYSYCSNYLTGYPSRHRLEDGRRAKGRDPPRTRRDPGTRSKRGRSKRIRGFFPFLFFPWAPTQVRIIYATTSIKVGEGDGQGEIADTRICKTRGSEGGGNGIYSSDNLHCHQHATKLDVARRDALYKRRRASHLHKVNCSLYFVTYSGISCTNYTTAEILARDLSRDAYEYVIENGSRAFERI